MNNHSQKQVRRVENQRPRKLGEMLMETKRINTSQLELALQEQKRLNENSKRKYKLGEILLFSKLIVINELHATLLKQRPRKAQDTEKLLKLREIKKQSLDTWLQKHAEESKREKIAEPVKEDEGFLGKIVNLFNSRS